MHDDLLAVADGSTGSRCFPLRYGITDESWRTAEHARLKEEKAPEPAG